LDFRTKNENARWSQSNPRLLVSKNYRNQSNVLEEFINSRLTNQNKPTKTRKSQSSNSIGFFIEKN